MGERFCGCEMGEKKAEGFVSGRGSSESKGMWFCFMTKFTAVSMRWAGLCLPHMLSSAQGFLSAPRALPPLLLPNLTHLRPWDPISSSEANSLLRTPTALTAKRVWLPSRMCFPVECKWGLDGLFPFFGTPIWLQH